MEKNDGKITGSYENNRRFFKNMYQVLGHILCW
jgi:hypothetical protein